MPFNSYSYLALLLPVAALYWAIPFAWRRVYLLVLSVAYYASWDVSYAPLPFLVCGIAWLCARQISAAPEEGKSRYLKLGITLTLLVLAFFKYRLFVLDNLNRLLAAFSAAPVETAFHFGLPIGISFYSFEAISYLIDTRQGRVKEVKLLDLSLFVTFWPHLMAGPIVRVRELIPQFHQEKRFELAMLTRGLDRLLWGFVQKNMIANNLSGWVDEGFLPKAAAANSSLDNWFLAFAFGLQIYFDFAAYSNMAIGAAQLVGITLPENFRYPYHAANPSDFWSRWHMTLSRWIRDYLFFPAGAKYKGAPGPLYVSLLVIMALVGLWHGAGWGFVIWGVFHGAYLVLYRIWEGLVETRLRGAAQTAWARWSWRAFTVAAVMLAWIPFRASSLGQTAAMLKTMLFGFRFSFSYGVNFYLVTLLAALFCLAEPFLADAMTKLEKRWSAKAAGAVWTLYAWRPLLYACALLLFLVFDDQDTQFIYFQF